MKKIIALTLLVVFALSAFTACSIVPEEKKAELEAKLDEIGSIYIELAEYMSLSGLIEVSEVNKEYKNWATVIADFNLRKDTKAVRTTEEGLDALIADVTATIPELNAFFDEVKEMEVPTEETEAE